MERRRRLLRRTHSAIPAGPDPGYFGAGHCITCCNLVSDHLRGSAPSGFTGLNAVVVPGTLRDGPLMWDWPLGREGDLAPAEIMTCAAAYADAVFGLSWLRGYQFGLQARRRRRRPVLAHLRDRRLRPAE